MGRSVVGGLAFPRMSFGDQTDRDGVVQVLVRDLTNVTGEDFPDQEVLCGAPAARAR